MGQAHGLYGLCFFIYVKVQQKKELQRQQCVSSLGLSVNPSAALPVAFLFSNLFHFFLHPHFWEPVYSRAGCAPYSTLCPKTCCVIPAILSQSLSPHRSLLLTSFPATSSLLTASGGKPASLGPDPHPSPLAGWGRAKARCLLLKRVKGPPFPVGCPKQLTNPESLAHQFCFAGCKLFCRFTKRPSKLFHK